MALIVVVAGPALISIDDYTGGGLRPLGYTRDGAEISEETFWVNVPGDQRGGEQGPPIEVQQMGQVDRVRLEFTKYDTAIMALIEANLPGGTAGLPYAGAPAPYTAGPGTLLFANGKFFRVCINSPAFPRNYYVGIPRAPRDLNKGSRFSTKVVEFECHAVVATFSNAPTGATAGVLYDAAIL